MTQFNFQRGSATPKGSKPQKIRLLSKAHTTYGIYLTPTGRQRNKEQQKEIFFFERRLIEKYMKQPEIMRKKQNEFYDRLKEVEVFNQIEFEDLIGTIII